MSTVQVQLNYLGVPVTVEYVARLRDGADHSGEFEYRMIEHVLEVPPEHVPADVLARYVEISNEATYTPIFPYTDRLFERFLAPLKSAKRCYCFGDYLATIELSAHVGEMVTLLIWKITPLKLNEREMNASIEKAIMGGEFERLGQERRIDILKALGVLSDPDEKALDFLRGTRRRHFHFWDTTAANAKDDALQCFLKITSVVKNIFRIEYHDGSVSMNPQLLEYIRRYPQPIT